LAKPDNTAQRMHQLALDAREKYAREILHINEVMKHIAGQATKGFMFVIIENKQGLPNLERTTMRYINALKNEVTSWCGKRWEIMKIKILCGASEKLNPTYVIKNFYILSQTFL
jgi:hypothetical protein